MPVCLRDGSALTIVRAATLRRKFQIELAISPSHGTLTPGQPVPALTLSHKAPGRVATGVPVVYVTGMTDQDKVPTGKSGIESRSVALEADALTNRPKRRTSCLLVLLSSGRNCRTYLAFAVLTEVAVTTTITKMTTTTTTTTTTMIMVMMTTMVMIIIMIIMMKMTTMILMIIIIIIIIKAILLQRFSKA